MCHQMNKMQCNVSLGMRYTNETTDEQSALMRNYGEFQENQYVVHCAMYLFAIIESLGITYGVTYYHRMAYMSNMNDMKEPKHTHTYIQCFRAG